MTTVSAPARAGQAPSSLGAPPGRRPLAARDARSSSFSSLSAHLPSLSAPAGAVSSRSNTSSLSNAFDADDKRRSQRRERGKLRDALNAVSRQPRFRQCGWPNRRELAEIAGSNGRAYWRGVQRCGSIHACAVCAATIRNYRAVEVGNGAATWIDAGNEVYMVTLTAPHDLGMKLDSLLDLISRSFSTVIGGGLWCGTPERYVPARMGKRGKMLPARVYPARPGIRDQLGIAGTVRSLEVTHGEHGWHPHLHVLVFVRGQLSASGLQKFDAHFRRQWHKAIAARHPRPPDPVHGVKIERCYSGEGAADYVCKTQEGHGVGIEMARGDIKRARGGHRTPFEILASAVTYDSEADVRLWHEFERATKGRKCITWSNGLRDAIADVAPELVLAEDWLVDDLTDEEIVALEPTFEDEYGNPHVEPATCADADTVATVSRAAARHARSVPGFRVTVLEAFEDGKHDGLADAVSALGFELAWGRDPLVPAIVLAARPVVITQVTGGQGRHGPGSPHDAAPSQKYIYSAGFSGAGGAVGDGQAGRP